MCVSSLENLTILTIQPLYVIIWRLILNIDVHIKSQDGLFALIGNYVISSVNISVNYFTLIIIATSSTAVLCDELHVAFINLEFHICFEYLIFSQSWRHISVSDCLVRLCFRVKGKTGFYLIIVI